MNGVNAFQIGPFGVSATSSRPAIKPSDARRLRVPDSATAHLDNRSFERKPQSRNESAQDPEIQAASGPVSPATLLDASLIASAIMPEETPAQAPSITPNSSWTPPGSGFHLRDRRI